jgi:hypothetical protein
MVLDMLTTDELDQLHARLSSGTIRLCEQLIAGCEADMHRTSGWFVGSPAHAVLKAAMAEHAELSAEVLAELRARWDRALTEVPMVCTACRKPVSEAEDNAGRRMWLHDFPADGGLCPRLDGPVKAMVAAGNENVPFSE